MPTEKKQYPPEQEMRDYLAEHNISNKQKQLGQLKRVYGSVHMQVEQGLKPSLRQAYGKEKQFYTYVPRQGKHLASFAALRNVSQVDQIVNRTTMESFTLGVYGIAIQYEARANPNRDWSKPTWLSVGPASRLLVEYSLSQHTNLTDFINEIAGPTPMFVEVLEVVILDTRSIRP